MDKFHKLLQRQIKKYMPAEFGKKSQTPISEFLNIVNQTYLDFESDRALIERAMDISSLELQEQQKKITQATKLASLGEMSASVAHELNNPLYIISGFNERIIKTLKRDHPLVYESVKEYFDDVLSGLGRIRLIINHLRDFARQSPHKKKILNLNEPIEKVLVLMRDQLKAKNIKIEKNLSELSINILGDAHKLEQVFVNLFANAIDAIESKNGSWGGAIKLSTSIIKDSARVEVQDDGCGMSDEVQLKVFDAFFTTKEVGKGTGLGGSISYGIIKEHDGNIECSSNEGIGSTFRISIPVAHLVENKSGSLENEHKEP